MALRGRAHVLRAVAEPVLRGGHHDQSAPVRARARARPPRRRLPVAVVVDGFVSRAFRRERAREGAVVQRAPVLAVSPRGDDDDEREPAPRLLRVSKQSLRVLRGREEDLGHERWVHLERPSRRLEVEEGPERTEGGVDVGKRRTESAVAAVERRRERLAPDPEVVAKDVERRLAERGLVPRAAKGLVPREDRERRG